MYIFGGFAIIIASSFPAISVTQYTVVQLQSPIEPYVCRSCTWHCDLKWIETFERNHLDFGIRLVLKWESKKYR